MTARFRWFPLGMLCLALPLLSAPARAFDTGPHYDMTRDAMRTEGFGETAIRLAQVSNWFCDLYEQDTSNNYSGHVSWGSFKGALGNLLTLFRKENWSRELVEAAEKLHFDSSTPIDSTRQAAAEWDRLARKTAELVRAHRNDPDAIMVLLGMTLHGVQDFYTHTNWVEPQGDRRVLGGSGPGWAARRTFGSHPTWFDVPDDIRSKEDIYSRKLPDASGAPGGVVVTNPDGTVVPTTPRPPRPPATGGSSNPIIRDHREKSGSTSGGLAGRIKKLFGREAGAPIKAGHGDWDSPASGPNLAEYAMNKDWAGRPFHTDAYITAYLATRQWIQAVRQWLGDEALWARLQAYGNDWQGVERMGRLGALSHDQQGAVELSWYVGHWNGNTGKAMQIDAVKAGVKYFDGRSKTLFRRKFETLATEIVKAPESAAPAPVPSSRSFAGNTAFVVVRVPKVRQIDETLDIDPGTEADYYMKIFIGGQEFRTSLINGHDTFTFPPPHFPFQAIKAIPAGAVGVGVRLQLWDDDFATGNDQADITAKDGSELRLVYNPKTNQVTGDMTGSGRMLTKGRGNDKAEVTFEISTLRVTPAPITGNILQHLQGGPILQLQKKP